jgi:hypothetical protein
MERPRRRSVWLWLLYAVVSIAGVCVLAANFLIKEKGSAVELDRLTALITDQSRAIEELVSDLEHSKENQGKLIKALQGDAERSKTTQSNQDKLIEGLGNDVGRTKRFSKTTQINQDKVYVGSNQRFN